jgi:hypothetical protein
MAKDTIIIVMQKIIIEGHNRRYTKTVGIQMTTDMPEIIKKKENMQTKKPWQKSSWKTLIPTMKQVKKRSIIALFLEIYRFLKPK